MRRTSRRRFVGAAGVAGMSAVLGAPGAALAAEAEPGRDRAATPYTRAGAHGALGANYNEYVADLDIRELQIGGTEWVRCFFPMPEAGQGELADNVTLRTILGVGARGYRTLLTLKFPYGDSAMPTPGSPAMETLLAQVDKVLAEVLDRVDILQIGNEPFIESLPEERGDTLNAFYETVARHVITYRRVHHGRRCRTRLYMGALNRLDLPGRRTAATERWMTFVRQTPEIDGVDIHPHVPSPDAVQPFLDYILPRMRPEQTFLATEFSLVWYWQAHMDDRIPAEFADRYGFAPTSFVWEVIQAAIERPFPQRQWDDFLSSSPWYESQRHFLRDQVEKFRATGRLAVATYGYRQGESMIRNWGPAKPPWLLNAVFAPRTVQPWRNGTTGRGYAWIEDFRALQRGGAIAGSR
ncbi:hypothetical protein [Streptomyces atrovirens]|uniref:Asl1-like glycosyl hydrolase catalytic domain-containing protein n=1 Tax=Streptomyces atrovirens TaxID=285556 RepID=A0ABW0DSM0_9ACTN